MSVVISDEILEASRMTAEELRIDVAILLYRLDRLSLGQARKMAGADRIGFQKMLAEREISIRYDLDDFEEDLRTLDQLAER